MHASGHDESDLFGSIATSGARALLIGRRALVVLGLPVLTADYDYWIHTDDIDRFNEAIEPLGFAATCTPEEARKRGRYVLENDDHIDVLVARRVSTKAGVPVAFDDVWGRRQAVAYDARIKVTLPSIDDLVLTKSWSMRPRDVDDIRMLEALKKERG